MRIEYLEDGRGHGCLERSLRKLPKGPLHNKVERTLGVLARQAWHEALEGTLVNRLGKMRGEWIYEIKIRGRPEYRIATFPERRGDEQCLLVGEIVTRESLNNQNAKTSFINRALEARERWTLKKFSEAKNGNQENIR